jgi:hypothetical protein
MTIESIEPVETAQSEADAPVTNRSRGRPSEPSLKVLLTEKFLNGATAQELAAAGYTGDISAALKRQQVKQADGCFILVAATATLDGASRPAPVALPDSPVTTAPVIDVADLQGVPDVLPAREFTEEEFLAQAEGQIRGYGRLLVSGIVGIGKKLVEVQEHLKYRKDVEGYEAFVRKRLGFSEDTALRFVRSYELLKSRNLRDLESLQIDASALYLLARPTTPEEVRAEALEKATTGGISHKEVQQLLADAKAEAERRTKSEVEKAAEEKFAAMKEVAEVAQRTSAEAVRVAHSEADRRTEELRQLELALAQSSQKVAQLEAATATLEQSIRAEIETQYQGNVISGEELPEQLDAALNKVTASLEEASAVAERPNEELSHEISEIYNRQAPAIEAAAEKVAAESQVPPLNSRSLAKTLFDRLAAGECQEIADALYDHLGTRRLSVETSSPADHCQIANDVVELFNVHEQMDLFRRMLSRWGKLEISTGYDALIARGTELNRLATID